MIHPRDLIEILAAIDYADEPAFRARQALVREIGLDEATLESLVGVLGALRLAFDGRRFDLVIEGVDPVLAIVIGVLDSHETMTDLVAWPIHEPNHMATFTGYSEMLGLQQVLEQTSLSAPLAVHRSALSWLRSRCAGCIPLDPLRAARVFLEAGGQLLAEDDAHGAELATARQALVSASPAIVVAERIARAA